MKEKPEIGNRKVSVNRQTSLMILLGFVLASYMKAPTELFVAFVIGLGGTAFSFMWGNAKAGKLQSVKDSQCDENIKK